MLVSAGMIGCLSDGAGEGMTKGARAASLAGVRAAFLVSPEEKRVVGLV